MNLEEIYQNNKYIIPRLVELGILTDGSTVRNDNVGKSDYSQRIIQPWSVWMDWNLNPWDADIIKRICRTKEETGMSKEEARIMDYKKIIHICKERIRQLKIQQLTHELNESEITKYYNFYKKHSKCISNEKIETIFNSNGIGTQIIVKCPICGEKEDITDYNSW